MASLAATRVGAGAWSLRLPFPRTPVLARVCPVIAARAHDMASGGEC